MAKENSDWGYDRFVGAMANLGYRLSDQTVGNILQCHGIPPAPERKRTTTRTDFIRAHMSVLAGTGFFSMEVLTLRGLVIYYVLFFIHLESRRVEIAGITQHPNEAWMRQIARNVTMDERGVLEGCRYLKFLGSKFLGSGLDSMYLVLSSISLSYTIRDLRTIFPAVVKCNQ